MFLVMKLSRARWTTILTAQTSWLSLVQIYQIKKLYTFSFNTLMLQVTKFDFQFPLSSGPRKSTKTPGQK